jgi:hypothetical protein
MKLNEMSSISAAKQKYKNNLDIVDSFTQKDLSPNKRYVKKMCDLYFEENIEFNEIARLFVGYESNRAIFDAAGVDFNKYNYDQLFELVYKATNEYADKYKLPNEITNSEDKLITVGLLKTFDDAVNLECKNSWCICVSDGHFEEHTTDGTLLYLIRNLHLSNNTECRFVVAQVYTNGERKYWSSGNHLLSNKHNGSILSISEYEETIKEIIDYLRP